MRHRDTQAKKYMCIQFRTLSHIDFSVSTNKDKCFVQTDRMNRNLTKKKSLFFPFFHCRISLFSVIIFYLVWLLFASHIFVCTTLNDMVYVFYTLECILYVYKYIFFIRKAEWHLFHWDFVHCTYLFFTVLVFYREYLSLTVYNEQKSFFSLFLLLLLKQNILFEQCTFAHCNVNGDVEHNKLNKHFRTEKYFIHINIAIRLISSTILTTELTKYKIPENNR